MSSMAVVNASPLIYLARSDLFHLLRQAGEDVVVTEAVASEILARGKEDVTAQAITETEWLREVETPAIPPVVQSNDGASPLHYARGHGVVTVLVEAGAKINAQNDDGDTALHLGRCQLRTIQRPMIECL